MLGLRIPKGVHHVLALGCSCLIHGPSTIRDFAARTTIATPCARRGCCSAAQQMDCSRPWVAAAAYRHVASHRSSVRTMQTILQRNRACFRSWVGTSPVLNLVRSARGCSRPRCFPPRPQSSCVCVCRPSAMRAGRSCAFERQPLRMLCCVVLWCGGGSEVRMVVGFWCGGEALKR